MKVVTAAEMRRIDSDTIEDVGVPGIVLMETAGRAIVDAIRRNYPTCQRVGIFVGKGNNGGDGLVVARQLAHAGSAVDVLLVSPSEDFKGNALRNLLIASRLSLNSQSVSSSKGIRIFCLVGENKNSAILRIEADDEAIFNTYEKSPHPQIDITSSTYEPNCELFVDAIFGIGLRGTVDGEIADVIEAINRQSVPTLSVDVPSGLDADTGHPRGVCVRAQRTVAIGLPKRGLLLHPGAAFAGQVDIADIGFPKSVVAAQNIKVNWTTAQTAANWLPARPAATHKGNYGRVLVVAGARGMTGAAALASEGALRAGAGLVTLAIPESLNPILEVKLSEVMTLPLPETDAGSLAESALAPILEFAKKTTSVLAIGPGLSQHSETAALVQKLVDENHKQRLGLRTVIDADGLNALAQHKILNQNRTHDATFGKDTVLTPHPGEMSRLVNMTVPELEAARIKSVQQFVREYGVTLVFKGAPTVIGCPKGDIWINSTGNPGMATAGMGDVLTGVIAGLMAQGLANQKAAVLGVYLHGLAADIASEHIGLQGLIASDVLNALPQAILSSIVDSENQ